MIRVSLPISVRVWEPEGTVVCTEWKVQCSSYETYSV